MGEPERSSSRRAFLRGTLLSTAALAIGARGEGEPAPTAAPRMTVPAGAGVPRRAFGRHPDQLSIVGFGAIVVMNAEPAFAVRAVAEAVERGVNYFDVAPSYGNAMERLGPALKPHRANCFLACKTAQRTAEGARADLEKSLAGMQTDRFDLYQMHALTSVAKDVDAAFAKGGAMEAFLEAKRDGRVRYLGFSAHSAEAALAAMERHDFDSVLFPFNLVMWEKGGFGPQVMERARAKGMAALALKAMAREPWASKEDPGRKAHPNCWYRPVTDPREVELSLRYTLSLPVTAALPPGDPALFRMALDVASTFRPITGEETRELRERLAAAEPLFRCPSGQA
jgi:aryl-alcohol dehydrogenase-like predicted oxidoreductase